MKRIPWLCAFCLLAGIFLLSAFPLFAYERVTRFDVEAAVEEDASLVVVERIGVFAEGKDIRRGIIRTIPTDFTDTEGVRRRAGFELLSAELDGKPTPAVLERVGESLDIRLGDPDIFLSHGEHLFTITYRTTGQLGFFEEHDELYWNVTGNDWVFLIESASFRMKLPGRNFGEGFTGVEFYTGKKGEQGRNARLPGDGSVESIGGVPPGEGLTVVYTWPKGIVAPPAGPAPALERWTASPLRMVHLAMPVILLVLMTVLWVLWGKDPPSQTIIPRFTPPKGVEAGFARYVRTMRMDDQSFAAMVLGVAVKGVLTVAEHSLATEAAKKTGKEIPQGGMGMKLLSKLVGKSYRLYLNREKLSKTGRWCRPRSTSCRNVFGRERSRCSKPIPENGRWASSFSKHTPFSR